MSWQLVKNAFFVEVDGHCKHIDIGVCANCNGIHIPPEEANACNGKEIPTIQQIMKLYTQNPKDVPEEKK